MMVNAMPSCVLEDGEISFVIMLFIKGNTSSLVQG